MSKYTTQVRFICETAAGLTESAGYKSVNEIIQMAIPKVFDFDFPIYDDAYRNVLCTKILKHYYTREIGAETVGLWKLWLDSKLNEIMPYYNQLYKSAMIEFDPMYDVNLTTEYNKKHDGTNDTTENSSENNSGNHSENTNGTNSESNEGSNNEIDSGNNSETSGGNSNETTEISGENISRNLFSDTPQGSLDNVENQTYLTNATKNMNEGSNTSDKDYEYTGSKTGEYSDTKNSTYSGTISSEHSGTKTSEYNNERDITKTDKVVIKNTEEYLQTIKGKSGGVSYSKRLLEFRQTFINIDVMVIEELSSLFMNIW